MRTLAPDARVFVLHGLAGAAPADFRAHRIIPVLMDASELPRVQAEAAARGPLDVCDPVRHRLSRLGLSRTDVKRLRDDPSPLAGLRIAAYVTHLAHFSNPVARHNDWQWRRFRAWTQALPPRRSASALPPACSAAGAPCAPCPRGQRALWGRNHPVQPPTHPAAARLTAPILRVMDVPAGTEVGYGGVYRTPQPARLAHVGVGYGGGLPFSFQRQAYGYVGGLPAPIVSGLAMSLMTLDVSGLPEGLRCGGAGGAVRPGAAGGHSGGRRRRGAQCGDGFGRRADAPGLSGTERGKAQGRPLSGTALALPRRIFPWAGRRCAVWPRLPARVGRTSFAVGSPEGAVRASPATGRPPGSDGSGICVRRAARLGEAPMPRTSSPNGRRANASPRTGRFAAGAVTHEPAGWRRGSGEPRGGGQPRGIAPRGGMARRAGRGGQLAGTASASGST